MNRFVQFFSLVIALFFSFPGYAGQSDEQAILTIVNKLQKAENRFLYCYKGDRKYPGFKDEYFRYFSRELGSLYGYQCLPGYRVVGADPRYGDYPLGAKDFTRKIENIKLSRPNIDGSRATVRATYDYIGGFVGYASYKDFGNYTVYNLIKEGGVWKIDDIGIGGNEHRETTDLETFTSLKKELRLEIGKIKERRVKK